MFSKDKLVSANESAAGSYHVTVIQWLEFVKKSSIVHRLFHMAGLGQTDELGMSLKSSA